MTLEKPLTVQKNLIAEAAGSKCRFCGQPLSHLLVDLGMSPLCESYIPAAKLNSMEPFYPLVVYVCDKCFLVQLDEYVSAEDIFTEYAYFSSYADSWVEHCRIYTENMIKRFKLSHDSLVVELASNDGYLLQHFVARSIPVLGIEPAANVAKVAIEKNIPTNIEFFGKNYARRLKDSGIKADLLLGNNVLAQVPDLNDFVAGMKVLLADDGIITMEFPHLYQLMRENQFDTIYHEHFSYFSFLTTQKIFEKHKLRLFDVEQLPTHGGSLRIYACHTESKVHREQPAVKELLDMEYREKFDSLETYRQFGEQVKETKRDLLTFLTRAKEEGKKIVGYGAPGKGNTLLNYCGIRTDFLEFTVDRNPYKQGKFLPGTHIPILHPDAIEEAKPDYVLILPWNFKDEIMKQISFIKNWGGQFVVPIPKVTIF